MKSCLILLGLWLGLGVYYYFVISGSPLAEQWWLAPLLSLSLVAFLANLQGIYIAIKQKIASSRPESQWKDGQLIGLSGRLQAIGNPIEAPFSGKRAPIVEYEVKRVVSSGDSTSTSKCLSGMLMSPCVIQTMRRSVKVIGFPLFTSTTARILSDEHEYQNAARYIASTTFEELPKNPIALIKKLNSHLSDDDGDLKADFKDQSFYLDDGSLDEDLSDDETESGEEKPIDPAVKEKAIYQQLIGGSYTLEENLFEQGAEVTVFGTYNARKQAVDIGNGLKNIQHSIQLGKLSNVIRKNFLRSFVWSSIFGAIAYFSHMYVARAIGWID